MSCIPPPALPGRASRRFGRAGYAESRGSANSSSGPTTRASASGPLVGPPAATTQCRRDVDARRSGAVETVAVGDVRDGSAARRRRPRCRCGRGRSHAFVGAALLEGRADGRRVRRQQRHAARAWTADGDRSRSRGRRSAPGTAVERARAESALREQTTRLGLALEASTGASWTWDVRTNRADWDDAFRARFAILPEEPPSFETWLARVHTDDRPRMLRTLEDVLQTRDTWDHTYRVQGPDGAVRWMQSLGRADRDSTGRVTQLTGLELDITERRRTEDVEHDRALRALLETATQGIVSSDAAGTIVFANRAFESMFGWAAEELIDTPIARLIPSMLRDGTHVGRDLVGTRKRRVRLSDSRHRQSRADPEWRTRICVRDRHHRTPACRNRPARAHHRKVAVPGPSS